MTATESAARLTKDFEASEEFSITDIVLNHTTNNLPALQEHLEASYHLVNNLHKIPAYLVDRAIHYTSKEVKRRKLENKGISAALTTD